MSWSPKLSLEDHLRTASNMIRDTIKDNNATIGNLELGRRTETALYNRLVSGQWNDMPYDTRVALSKYKPGLMSGNSAGNRRNKSRSVNTQLRRMAHDAVYSSMTGGPATRRNNRKGLPDPGSGAPGAPGSGAPGAPGSAAPGSAAPGAPAALAAPGAAALAAPGAAAPAAPAAALAATLAAPGAAAFATAAPAALAASDPAPGSAAPGSAAPAPALSSLRGRAPARNTKTDNVTSIERKIQLLQAELNRRQQSNFEINTIKFQPVIPNGYLDSIPEFPIPPNNIEKVDNLPVQAFSPALGGDESIDEVIKQGEIVFIHPNGTAESWPLEQIGTKLRNKEFTYECNSDVDGTGNHTITPDLIRGEMSNPFMELRAGIENKLLTIPNMLYVYKSKHTIWSLKDTGVTIQKTIGRANITDDNADDRIFLDDEGKSLSQIPGNSPNSTIAIPLHVNYDDGPVVAEGGSFCQVNNLKVYQAVPIQLNSPSTTR